MLNYSSGLLDNFAPSLSKLTKCELPDMSIYDSQSSHWVQNFLLNSTFRCRYPDPFHQIAISYMRRAEAVFHEYANARTYLIDYLSGRREALSKYFSSIYHFEQLVTQAYQAYMLMKHLLDNKRLYFKGDGSELDRLNIIYNYIKHCDDKLNNKKFPENATIPIWLTNESISCIDGELRYEELVDILKDIANGANRFGDPSSVMNEPTV